MMKEAHEAVELANKLEAALPTLKLNVNDYDELRMALTVAREQVGRLRASQLSDLRNEKQSIDFYLAVITNFSSPLRELMVAVQKAIAAELDWRELVLRRKVEAEQHSIYGLEHRARLIDKRKKIA